tara:strand:+ start:1315 stop:1467 length:153 start_codon:yes stop_codon:yes gene_type:complete
MWFFKEFFAYLKARKRYWMIPLYILLLIFGTLLVVSSGAPSVAPFIYTVF